MLPPAPVLGFSQGMLASFAPCADDIGRDRARIGQIGFGRRDHVRRGDLPVGPVRDRAGLLHVGVGFGERVSSW